MHRPGVSTSTLADQAVAAAESPPQVKVDFTRKHREPCAQKKTRAGFHKAPASKIDNHGYRRESLFAVSLDARPHPTLYAVCDLRGSLHFPDDGLFNHRQSDPHVRAALGWRVKATLMASCPPRADATVCAGLAAAIIHVEVGPMYRAVDNLGRTVDFLLSERRDVAAAKRFFSKAMKKHGTPRSSHSMLTLLRIEPSRNCNQRER